VDGLHRSRHWSRHLDHGLVRFKFDERLILRDGLTHRHQNVDHVT
jgi:hypothetical protein